MLSPISGCNVGTANHNVQVVIRNYSASIPVSPGNITVRYQINTGPIVSQVIGSFLPPNATFNFTFSQTQNFSACSQWNVKVWTSYAPDINPLNDTIQNVFINNCTPIPGSFVGPTAVCDGNDFDSIQVVGGSYAYGLLWQSQVLPGSFTSTGVTSTTYYLNNLTIPTNYRVVYAGGLCPNVISSVYSVGISPPLNTGTPSSDLDFCSSNVVGGVQITGFTSTLTTWEQSTNGGASWTSLGTNANPFSINGYSDSTLFRALISSGGCGSGYSDTIAVNIEPETVPGVITGSTAACFLANAGTLNLVGNLNYLTQEWYSSTDNIIFTPTGITANSLTYNNLTQTTYYKVKYTCNLCPDSETPVATITVDPTLNLGTNSPNLVLCSDNTVGAVSVSGFSSSIMDWLESSDGILYTSTGLSSNSLSTSGLTSTTYYKAIIESGACGMDTTAAISVTIEPVVIPGTILGSATVCENANSGNLTLSGNANQTSLEWYISNDNIVFTPTGITTNTYPYLNLTQTSYFKVLLEGNQCSDVETPVAVITVDPALNLGTTSSDLVLCETNIAGTISLSGFSSTLVQWEQSILGSGIWTSTGSNATPYSIAGISQSTLFRANVESGTCGSGYSDTISVIVEETIVPGSIAGATTVCESSNSGILTHSGNSNDFGTEWYISTDNLVFTPTGNTTSTYSYTNLTQTTYFKIVLFGDICVDTETPVVAVNVDPSLDKGTPSADLNLCSDNISGNISLSGFSSTIVNWEESILGSGTWTSTGSNSNPLSIVGTSVSTLFRAVISSGVCGTMFSDTIAVLIEPIVIPGTISGGITVCSGNNSGILTLSGNANDFGFEWYVSTDGVNFVPTSITSNTFNYSNIAQTTYYKVILQGNYCSDAETPVATITVDQPLNLGTVSSDLTLCADNVFGSVSISGAVSLQDWEQSNNYGVSWFSTIDNNASHDISALTDSAWFRALVSSGTCGSGYSDTIQVHIEPEVIPGNISPSDTTVCQSSNSGVLTLSGNANDFGMEWYISTDNITFLPTGNTTSTMNFASLTQTTYFKVVLQGNICSNSETTVRTVFVDPAINLGTTSADLTICANNISGAVSIAGAVNLQDWEQSNNYGVSWFSTGDNNASHDISALTDSAWFRALISSGVCGSAYSATIHVNIEPQLISGNISPLNTTVCESSNSGVLTLTGNANDLGYQWYISTDNVNFLPTGNTTPTINYSSLTQTTYFKVILLGNICADIETAVATVFVDPALNLGTTSPDLLLCANDITGTIQLTGANVLMNWEQSNNNGATWSTTAFTNSSINISYLSSTTWFRALVSSGVCGTGYSDTIVVTIAPEIIPGTISGPTSVCASANAGTMTYTGGANQTSLEWYSSTDNVNFTPTGVTTSAYAFSNLNQTTFFMVVLASNACSGIQSSIFTLAVDPILNLGIPSPDLALCESNITGSVSLTGAVSIQDWQQSTNGGSTWSSLGTNNSSYPIPSITETTLFRAFISSGACGSGFSNIITVTVDPVGVPAIISSDFTNCIGSGEIDSIYVISHNGSLSTWQTSLNGGTTWNLNGINDSTTYISNLLQTTMYQLVTSHGVCPDVVSNTSVGTLAPIPAVSAGTDVTIPYGSSVQLSGSGGLFGIWTPPTFLSNPNLSSPLTTPDSNITYAYTVIDVNGCTNTDYVSVTVDTSQTEKEDEEDLIVYNILTLNGDGNNEVFVIEGLEKYPNNKVLIFNGNGTLIYTMENYQNDWDGSYNGQLLPDGVYLYAIEVSRLTKHRGYITIMRDE
jgi:gliding motility-associated-like protein